MEKKPKTKSLSLVETPLWLEKSAYVLVWATFASILMLGFVPWQQTVMGTGRITSFSPGNRPQQIESPIKGRIKEWLVVEGMHVKKDDVLLTLQDLDKEFLPKELIELNTLSKTSLESTRLAYVEKANSIQASIDNLKQNLQDSLDGAKQNVRIAKGELETAKLNLTRTNTLAEKGLSSIRDKELAIQADLKAKGDLQRSEIELERISSRGLSDIRKMESEKSTALAEAAKISDELAKIELKLATARTRRDIAEVRSPIDGIVVKLYKRGPGETFKENEPVAVISPETMDQAAEVYVSDIDAPLILPGSHARLQFSGWPALQFAGLSGSIQLGTFGGTVAVVDNVDSGNGKYRVLIIPDSNSKQPWPPTKYLRPGTRVASWIILKTVPLGYELWRRFNGFPIGLTDVKNTTYSNSSEDEGGEGSDTEKNAKISEYIFKDKK